MQQGAFYTILHFKYVLNKGMFYSHVNIPGVISQLAEYPKPLNEPQANLLNKFCPELDSVPISPLSERKWFTVVCCCHHNLLRTQHLPESFNFLREAKIILPNFIL